MAKLPDLAPVESSMLAGIHYDTATKVLTAKFKGGKIYQYPDVAPERAATVMGAQSVGRAFNEHVKAHHIGREVFGGDD